MPAWATEIVVSVEDLGGPVGDGPVARAALVAFRAPGRAWIAGTRGHGGSTTLDTDGAGRPLRLAVRPLLPAVLEPATVEAVRSHLSLAASRGLGRRDLWQADLSGIRWTAGAAAVLHSESGGGRAAQATVAISGHGDPGVLTPPHGGALLVRAWRHRGGWSAICALVLASPDAFGLGRAGGRLARHAITRGWDATVLTGPAAAAAARAGDPHAPRPRAGIVSLTAERLGELITRCALSARPGPPAQGTIPFPQAPDHPNRLATLLRELAARPLPAPPFQNPG